MADLRRHSDIPFSAHMIDLPKAVALRCPDCIMNNVKEHGGIARTRDFIRACKAFGVAFRFDSGQTGIASAAYLHLSAAMEHVRGASQTLFHWYADDVIEGRPFALKHGVTRVRDGPRLGVTLDETALARSYARHLAKGSFPDGRSVGYGSVFRKR